MLICHPANPGVPGDNVVPLTRRFASAVLPTRPKAPASPDTDWAEVLATYHARIVADPTQPEGWLQLAHLLTVLDRPADALTTLTRALSHFPLNPDILLAAGDGARACEDHARALRYYGRVVRLQPGNSQALFAVALTQESLDDIPAAQASYEALLAQDPDWIPAWHNLGTLYMRHGETRRAVSLFRSMRARFPAYRPAQLGLAMAYDYAGEHDSSLRLYTRLLGDSTLASSHEDLRARVAELQTRKP